MANLTIKEPPVFTENIHKTEKEEYITAELENKIKEELLNNDVFLKTLVEKNENDHLYSKNLEEADLLTVEKNGIYYVTKAENSPTGEEGYLEVFNHPVEFENRRVIFWRPHNLSVGGYFNVLTDGVWSGWQQNVSFSELENEIEKRFSVKTADATQNPETYKEGYVYLVEDELLEENGHPYTTGWNQITYLVFGKKGNKTIIAVDMGGTIYIKSQIAENMWNGWNEILNRTETISNRNRISNNILTGSTFTNKSWVGVGHNLENAPALDWFNYLCLDAAATGSDISNIIAMEINGSNPHLYFTNNVKGKSWKRALDSNDLCVRKSLGENYTMTAADFDKIGFYEISSLADTVTEEGISNIPDNDVGDYKILTLNPNKNFQTLLMTSPRYNSTFYIGRFWNTKWCGWTRMANTENLSNPNLIINSYFKDIINQQGQAEYTEGVTVDRWKIYGGVLKVKNHQVTLAPANDNGGYILQMIENGMELLKNQTVTLSVKIDGKVYFKTYTLPDLTTNNFDAPDVHFPDGSADIYRGSSWIAVRLFAQAEISPEWIKLEFGDTATMYVPPNPTIGLLECQRFLQKIGGWWKWMTVGFVSKENKVAYFPLILQSKMRAVPTLTIKNKEQIKVIGESINTSIVDLEGFQHASENYYNISFQLPAGTVVEKTREMVMLYFGENVELIFNAELK